MNQNKTVFLFAAGIALFVGLSLGYVLGSWKSVVTPSGERPPKVFGIGTELIDRPTAPDGMPFNFTSVFAFTEDFFHCVVLTNERPFTFKTYKLGPVEIGKNQFFMSVDSVKINQVKKAGGRAELKGSARSITRVGEKYEEAVVPFTAVAVDGGPGREKDSLVLTVFYNEKDSPMQWAIFGHEPRFGQAVNILSGNISIAEN